MITFGFVSSKMQAQANTNSQSNEQESDDNHDPTFSSSFPLSCVSFNADNLKKKITTIIKKKHHIKEITFSIVLSSLSYPLLSLSPSSI